MPQGLVAVGGKQKNVSECFIAIGGKWKRINDAYVSNSGQWKSAWTGAPELEAIALDRHSSAPWTRQVFSYRVSGMWKAINVVLIHPSGTRQVLATHPAVTEPTTVSNTGSEVTGLTPNSNYVLEVSWTSSSDKVTVMDTRAQTTVAPPVASNFWLKGPITPYEGGLEWSSFTDVQNWYSVRNNDGKAWYHNGNIPYIYEHGLSPSTRYYYQTKCQVGGVWGALSAQQYFDTKAKPYNAGDYYLYPNGNSQTWQSSGADWQGNSRDWWYHANGSYWGSSRGNQLTCIYYNNDNTMAVLRDAIANGAQVTRTRVYVHRANVDAGNGGGVPSTCALNGAAFSNNPWNVSGNHQGPHLNKGTGAWYDIPAHWGRHLFESPGSYTGIILGDTSDRNFYMALGKSNYSTGHMIITIA